MSTNDVIESYVVDVIRRVPRKERNEIGLELRGLLAEMLADRAQSQGKAASSAGDGEQREQNVDVNPGEPLIQRGPERGREQVSGQQRGEREHCVLEHLA